MSTSDYSPHTWGQAPTWDFTTPSGQLCHIRGLEMEDLIELDIVDDIDTLSSLVNAQHIEPVTGKRPQDRQPKTPTKAELLAKQEAEGMAVFREMTKDKDGFRRLMFVIDKATVAAVVKPALTSAYKTDETKVPVEERVPGNIYCDSVPMGDRMAIFQAAVGRLGDLSQFPSGQNEDLDAVEKQSDDEVPSE